MGPDLIQMERLSSKGQRAVDFEPPQGVRRALGVFGAQHGVDVEGPGHMQRHCIQPHIHQDPSLEHPCICIFAIIQRRQILHWQNVHC